MAINRMKVNLADFSASEDFGFLFPNPVSELTEYFSTWNDLGLNLVQYIQDGSIRERVHSTPVLDNEKLDNPSNLRLAQIILSSIANAYVWGEGIKAVPKMLPRPIAVPLWEVSKRLGINPLINYSCFCLANWKPKNKTESALSLYNREVIITIPGTDSADWFLVVSQQVDLSCGPGLQAVLDAQKATMVGDIDGVLKALRVIAMSLKAMEKALRKIHERCDPAVFYNIVRIYLMGWGCKAFEEAGFPEGLIYEGVSEIPQKYLGGSGAQSPSLQFFDAALGIEHTVENENFHKALREQMFPAHRELISIVRTGPSIKSFVHRRSDTILTKAYDNCIQAMVDFRTYHIKVTVRFITVPLHKAEKRDGKEETALNKGTGESDMMLYLKSSRASTSALLSEIPLYFKP
ncbi:indoleamine 2,3-dioxygenase 2-like [Glandiceps talaboti]